MAHSRKKKGEKEKKLSAKTKIEISPLVQEVMIYAEGIEFPDFVTKLSPNMPDAQDLQGLPKIPELLSFISNNNSSGLPPRRFEIGLLLIQIELAYSSLAQNNELELNLTLGLVLSKSMLVLDNLNDRDRVMATLAKGFNRLFQCCSYLTKNPKLDADLKRILKYNLQTAIKHTLMSSLRSIVEDPQYLAVIQTIGRKTANDLPPSQKDSLKLIWKHLLSLLEFSIKAGRLIEEILKTDQSPVFHELNIFLQFSINILHAALFNGCKSHADFFKELLANFDLTKIEIHLRQKLKGNIIGALLNFYNTHFPFPIETLASLEKYSVANIDPENHHVVIKLFSIVNTVTISYQAVSPSTHVTNTLNLLYKQISKKLSEMLSIQAYDLKTNQIVLENLLFCFSYEIDKNPNLSFLEMVQSKVDEYTDQLDIDNVKSIRWLLIWSNLLNLIYSPEIKSVSTNPEPIIRSLLKIKNLIVLFNPFLNAFSQEHGLESSLPYTIQIHAQLFRFSDLLLNIKKELLSPLSYADNQQLEEHLGTMQQLKNRHALFIDLFQSLSEGSALLLNGDKFNEFCTQFLSKAKHQLGEIQAKIDEIQSVIDSDESMKEQSRNARNLLIYEDIIKSTQRKIFLFNAETQKKPLAKPTLNQAKPEESDLDETSSPELIQVIESYESNQAELFIFEKARQQIQHGQWVQANSTLIKLSKGTDSIAAQALDLRVHCLSQLFLAKAKRHLTLMNAKLNSTEIGVEEIESQHKEKLKTLSTDYTRFLNLISKLKLKLKSLGTESENLPFLDEILANITNQMSDLNAMTKHIENLSQSTPSVLPNTNHQTSASPKTQTTASMPTNTGHSYNPNNTTTVSTQKPITSSTQPTVKAQIPNQPNAFTNLNEVLAYLESNDTLTHPMVLALKTRSMSLLEKFESDPQPELFLSPEKINQFLYHYLTHPDLVKRYTVLSGYNLFKYIIKLHTLDQFNPNQGNILASLKLLAENIAKADFNLLDYDLIVSQYLKTILIHSIEPTLLKQYISNWGETKGPIAELIKTCDLNTQAQTYLYALLTTEVALALSIHPEPGTLPEPIQAIREQIITHNQLISRLMRIQKNEAPVYFYLYGSAAVTRITQTAYETPDWDCATNLNEAELKKLMPIQKILNLNNMNVYHRLIPSINTSSLKEKVDHSISIKINTLPLPETLNQLDVTLHQTLFDFLALTPMYMTPEASHAIRHRILKSIYPIKHYKEDPQKLLRLITVKGNYAYSLEDQDDRALKTLIQSYKETALAEKSDFINCGFDTFRLQHFLFKFTSGKASAYFSVANTLQLIGCILPIPIACLPLSSGKASWIQASLENLDSEYQKKNCPLSAPAQLAKIVETILFNAISNLNNPLQHLKKIIAVIPKYFPNEKIANQIINKLNISPTSHQSHRDAHLDHFPSLTSHVESKNKSEKQNEKPKANSTPLEDLNSVPIHLDRDTLSVIQISLFSPESKQAIQEKPGEEKPGEAKPQTKNTCG